MSASIITFADLGTRKNLRTVSITPVIDVFNQHSELDLVICRRQKDAASYVHQALPSFLFYILKAISKVLEKIIPSFPGRNFEEELFDINAARLISKTDIVFFHPSFFPRTIRKAKKQGAVTVGFAVVVYPDTSLHLLNQEHTLLSLGTQKGLKRSRWSHDRKDVANAFDYIIANSDFVKRSYINNGFAEDKIFVVHSTIDHTRFAKQEKTDDIFRVVYVAHTNTLKGLHYLLDAWQLLDIPNKELILVGGYSFPVPAPLKERYTKIIESDSSIRWVGYTKTPDEYYSQASVFVLPSLTEGNPRVVMEAMASSLPVITTENATSIIENEKTGFIVPIRDAHAIYEKLNFLHQHPDIAKQVGNNARHAVENMQQYGNAVFEVYKEIMKREGKILNV